MNTTTLTTGNTVTIIKGCADRGIKKGTRATITDIVEMGPDHGHFVKVVLAIPPTRMGNDALKVAFYARHINRLSDAIVNLNDGNPLHKIQVKRA